METGRRMGSQGEAELGCSSPGFGCCEFGHGLGQTLGDGEGKRSLECCSPWGREESGTTGRLNSSENPKDAWDRKPSITLKGRSTTEEVGLWQVRGEDDVISGGDACLGLELWLPGCCSSSHPSCNNLSQDQGNLRKLHKAVEMGVSLDAEVTRLTWVLFPSY